jgi:hypothetical protein
MHRTTTPPLCFLETANPVWHNRFDKHFRQRKVCGRFRFDQWHPAHSLSELIKAFEPDINRRKWRSDPEKGTVNGIKMRLIRSRVYPDDTFTRSEIGAPNGYTWWEYLPDTKKVRILSVSPSSQAKVDSGTEQGTRIVADPRYLPPLLRALPKGWKTTGNLSGYIPEDRPSAAISVESALHYLTAFADGKPDDGAGGAFDVPEITKCFPVLFCPRVPRSAKSRKFVEAASARVSNSPSVLYRLLFWSGELKVTADDFYKGRAWQFFHPNGRWFINVEFWKRELSLRLYVAEDEAKIVKRETGPISIRCGIPGSHNGEIRTKKEAREYFRLFRKIIRRRTMIYSGNNFAV